MPPLRKETSLGYRANLLARMLERALRDQIARYGVVPGQFPALLALYEEDGQTQAQLGERVQIEQPTIAKTLQRMERDGLVERVPDPADGRRARIHLTPRARELQAALTTAAREVNAQALKGLPNAEARKLMDGMQHAIDNLMAARSTPT